MRQRDHSGISNRLMDRLSDGSRFQEDRSAKRDPGGGLQETCRLRSDMPLVWEEPVEPL
jgi:hypothetical protein